MLKSKHTRGRLKKNEDKNEGDKLIIRGGWLRATFRARFRATLRWGLGEVSVRFRCGSVQTLVRAKTGFQSKYKQKKQTEKKIFF